MHMFVRTSFCHIRGIYENILEKGFSSGVYISLSYDVASECEITPCNKIDKPLVVYRFSGIVMASMTTLRT